MKAVARIYRWILIAVILQLGVLAYFDFFYLPGGGNIRATMYEAEGEELTNWSVKIPGTAEDIKVSQNGRFAGYISGDKLHILDVRSKKVSKTFGNGKDKIPFYRWLPDRNMIIYSIQSKDGKQGSVKITTYDLDSGVERSYPEISGLQEGSFLADLELSPLTNVVYAKVKVSDTKAKVYKFNIMDNLKFVMNMAPDEDMRETGYTDRLLYEKGGKLYVRDGRTGSASLLAFKNNMALLYIDSEDKAYAGQLNSEKAVENIFYGEPGKEAAKSWKQVKLERPALPEDILISASGMIFIQEKEEHAVYNPLSGERITFEGNLIQVFDRSIITRDGGRLKLTVFK